MKYLKNFKFWIISIVLVYSVIGFIFIPWFLINKTPKLLEEKIGIHVEIKKAKFNPYTFKLEIDNFLLKDLKNYPVVSFKKLVLNYAPTWLLENTFLFESLSIDSPKFYATIKKDGTLNLENIVPPNQSITKQQKDKNTNNLAIITLQNLTITNGNIKFSDLRAQKEFNVNLGPYNFEAHDISTKKNALNAHNFLTKINKYGELFWEGGVRLNPLKLYGEINIKKLELPSFYKYAVSNLDATLSKGTLDLKIPYKIDLSKELKINISEANASISNLIISNKKTDKKIAKITKINLDEFNLKWPEQKIKIATLTVDNPYVFTLLNKDKELTLIKAFSNNLKKDENTTSQDITPSQWSFSLKNTYLNNANIDFIDGMGNTPIKTELTQAFLHIENISLDNKMPIEFKIDTKINKSSQLKSSGLVLTKPFKLSSDIILKDFNAVDYEAYVNPYLNFKIANTKIDTKTHVEITLKNRLNMNISSDTSIKNLSFKTNDNQRFLEWKNLDINNIEYTYSPMELSVQSINLDKPFVKLHIDKNGKTNFSELINVSKKTKKSPKKENKDVIKIKIGPIKLANGISDFSDFSLPFPFQTHIHDLNGNLSALNFQSTTPVKLGLTGKIDKYGYADIKGSLVPQNISKHANLDILFKNINLTSLTPYSSKFVGYKIRKGKLSMDLKYAIKKSALVGDNKLNLDTLELGEVVESKDATSLPLELAIALLKDADNQIDINMPVTGDVDNPEFSYGSVIWKAIGNMIIGITTAPFKFLGNMLGIDGEKLKSIDFALASNEIINTEHEKLQNLEKILSKRPNLKLTITGSYDKVLDKKAFQKLEFQKRINATHKLIKETNKDKKVDTYVLALKNLYLKTNTIDSYKKLKKSFIDKKTTKLDILAFNKSIKSTLINKIKITKSSLLKLAQTRAEVIKKELTLKYKIDGNRIEILPSEHTSAKRDEWVGVKLNIKS